MPDYSRMPLDADIEELAWMEGRWLGHRKGDTIEEHWSAPSGGNLMGMCRVIRDGQVRFFELCAIEPEGQGVAMRIKHFHPQLKGWEAQDESIEFDLVTLEGTQAIWCKRGAEGRWLVYERVGSTLRAWFENAGEEVDPLAGFVYELMR